MFEDIFPMYLKDKLLRTFIDSKNHIQGKNRAGNLFDWIPAHSCHHGPTIADAVDIAFHFSAGYTRGRIYLPFSVLHPGSAHSLYNFNRQMFLLVSINTHFHPPAPLICHYIKFTSYFSGLTSCAEAVYFLFLFCILNL